MRQTREFLLVTLATLGSNALVAQTETAVDIGISEVGTCLIGNLEIPCSEVGKNLRELRTPPDAHIHLTVDPRASYYAVSAALEGLRHTGLKLGYVNVRDH